MPGHTVRRYSHEETQVIVTHVVIGEILKSLMR